MAAIVSYAIWSCLGTCTEHRIEQNIDCALQKTQCMTINNCRGSRILPMKSTTIMTESLCKGGISVSPRQGSNSSEDPHKIWHKLNPNKRGWTLHQVTMYLFYNEFFLLVQVVFEPVPSIRRVGWSDADTTVVDSNVKPNPHHPPPPTQSSSCIILLTSGCITPTTCLPGTS